jgi:NAD(P)-dependent dehydrogenase (short-subunit alcohol dehydrogenase family)
LEKIVARILVGRLGKAEDIARTVLFLVADEADFITGSTLGQWRPAHVLRAGWSERSSRSGIRPGALR